jgi:hypothetical protein
VVLPAACSSLIVGARSAARYATRRPFDHQGHYFSDDTGFEHFGFTAFLAERNKRQVVENPLLECRVLIDQLAVGPSPRHIGGFTPSAPITTAAASGLSFFITTKTLRPTASSPADGALTKATTVASVGMVIVCSPPL